MKEKSKNSDRYLDFLKTHLLLVLPVANPDGVSRGLSNIDLSQNDSETMLQSSTQKVSPELFQLKILIQNLQQKKLLKTILVFKS